ncbi:MAG: hypothetical protein AAGD01_06460 [Acidobacteriota bacterium]
MRSRASSASTIVFPGIDAATGCSLDGSVSTEEFAQRLRELRWGDEERLEKDFIARWRDGQEMGPDRRPAADVDPASLASSGWGVVFPAKPKLGRRELQQQLAPLLDLRRKQVTEGQKVPGTTGPQSLLDSASFPGPGIASFFRLLTYCPGPLNRGFLSAHNIPSGPARPEVLPYYLLLVGDAEEIPLSFQYLLDVQYAVGRLAFDELEDYGRYARAVVAAETQKRHNSSAKMSFVSVRNQGDAATRLMDEKLVGVVCELMRRERSEWAIQKEGGSKEALSQLLCSGQVPALLFTTSHGAAYSSGAAGQREHQGDILCSEWAPGQPADAVNRFGAEDLRGADLRGLVAFLFGCYTAGTPQHDNFPAGKSGPQRIAPRPFFSKLGQTFLRQGALAVLGHFDRAWTLSFDSLESRETRHIESMVKYLLDGYPVGHAMDWMNERHADLASQLSGVTDPQGEDSKGLAVDDLALARLWRAYADARNFVVLGDPAVRLAVGPRRSLLSAPSPSTMASVSPQFALGDLRVLLGEVAGDEPVRSAESPVEILRRLRSGRRRPW